MTEIKNLMDRRGFMIAAGAATLLGLGGLSTGYLVFRTPDSPKDFFKTLTVPTGESAVVSCMVSMLKHEIKNGWCPSSILPWERMAVSQKGFQYGILKGCEGTVQVLRDTVARLRGTSDADPDLKDAFRRLSYPENKWSLFFQANDTVDQLTIGIKSLEKYNARLAKGNATYDRRADSLREYIKRDTNDFGSYEAELDKHADQDGVLSLEAQLAYYKGLGLLYSNYNLYKAIKVDFSDVLKYFTAVPLFDKALEVMGGVSDKWEMPVIVINDKPGDLFGSHLKTLSGGLTRIKVALNEVSDAVGGQSSASTVKRKEPAMIAKIAKRDFSLV